MKRILDFLKQQIFPGIYAEYANRKISKIYNDQQNYSVDISAVAGSEDEYIKQVKTDLENQHDRKKRIEDKAKSLLFIIAVTITAITFSLNYLNSLINSKYQLISICVLFLSIIYFVLGAIRALQSLNIRQFNINQADVTISKDKFILEAEVVDTEFLKDIIKCKQLNDLIINRLTNYIYASFNLIRNGIVLFVLFFITTICISYINNVRNTSGKHIISREIKVNINDSLNIKIPYTLEIQYEINNLKLNNNLTIRNQWGQPIDFEMRPDFINIKINGVSPH
jgi:hypothetical protein